MSELERHDTSKDRVIKPDGKWWLVLIEDDDSSTFFDGPGTFVAEAFLSITGLTFGDDPARVRFGRYKADGGIDYYPEHEIFGSQGTSFGHTGLVNWLPEKTKLRLYINAPREITITQVYASCLHD